MIVKNTSGAKRYFHFGKNVRGFSLEDGAQKFVPDSEVALQFAQKYEAEGLLDIIGASAITSVLSPVAVPASFPITATSNTLANHKVKIDDVEFEFKAADDGLPTTVEIGSDAEESLKNFTNKVNSYSSIPALNMTADVGALESGGITIGGDQAAVLYSKRPGTFGNGATDVAAGTGHTITLTGANLADALSLTNPAGGADSASRKVVAHQATVSGTPDPYVVFTGLKSITNLHVQVRSAAGAAKAITSLVTTEGGVIKVVSDGATNLADTDVIDIIAVGTY